MQTQTRNIILVLGALLLVVSCCLVGLISGIIGYAIGSQGRPPSAPALQPPLIVTPLPWVPPEAFPEEPERWQVAALVMEVEPDSPAEEAGLQVGDFIIAVDDQPLKDKADLKEMIGRYRPGDRVRLTVWRYGQKLSLRVRLGERDGRPYLGIRYRLVHWGHPWSEP